MRVLVANAGTHPEPARLASGFAERGHEVQYWTSSSLASGSMAARLASAPAFRSSGIARMVQRRVLPPGLTVSEVRHVAVGRELRFQVDMRRSLDARERALRGWLSGYEAAMASRVARREFDVVFSQYMWAAGIFEATRPGALKVLGYPTAHHRWIQRYFDVEAEANPDWAPFLQGHDDSPDVTARFDREIDLADVVMVPSTFAARTFLESGVPSSKLEVVQLAPAISADLEPSPIADRELWGGTAGGLRVLWVGQVTQRKGISYLLDAVEALPGVQLQIVGDAMPGIAPLITGRPRVHLVGSRSRSVVRAYLDAADVLVLPSLAEGFPLGAIEAMRCGVPVVISTNTFADDVVSDKVDGIIIPPRDAAALAAALEWISDNPDDARRMGDRGRDAAKEFTWGRYQERAVAALTKRRRT